MQQKQIPRELAIRQLTKAYHDINSPDSFYDKLTTDDMEDLYRDMDNSQLEREYNLEFGEFDDDDNYNVIDFKIVETSADKILYGKE